jgi:hypothetical protein
MVLKLRIMMAAALSVHVHALFAQDKPIIISDNLELVQISERAYIHISYYDNPGFNHTPANGLVYLNHGDAHLDEWPGTLRRVLEIFPQSEIVIPGHGDYGDLSVVYHTLKLLDER